MEKRAGVYARTANEDGSLTAIPLQEDLCRRLCDEHGWRVVAVESDTASGLDEDRPGWSRIVNMAKAEEIDVIVASDPDRISRADSVYTMLNELTVKHGVGFATVKSGIHTSPEDAQVVRIRMMFDDYESDRQKS
ncbi:recombinase family protein [Promicromonospora vindobonensis]|uniref:Recombinase family protein n=1 Tax=Promicromonospora vindobonensis TaxID=195748 RepID=A0ABW5VSM7_9MICO